MLPKKTQISVIVVTTSLKKFFKKFYCFICLYTNIIAANSVKNLELGLKDGTYVIVFISENGEKTSKILQVIQ